MVVRKEPDAGAVDLETFRRDSGNDLKGLGDRSVVHVRVGRQLEQPGLHPAE